MHKLLFACGEDWEVNMAYFDENLEVEPYREDMGLYFPDHITAILAKPDMEPDAPEILEKLNEWVGRDVKFDGNWYYFMETLNPNGMWDWYTVGGRWDHLGDHLTAKEVLEEEIMPSSLLTVDGKWLDRERFDGQKWISNPTWDKEYFKSLNPKEMITIVDYHY